AGADRDSPSVRGREMRSKYIVRHSAMRYLGEFEAPEGQSFPRAARVVLRSDRGQEVGEVLCKTSARAVELLAEPTREQILRLLSDEDRQTLDRMRDKNQHAFDTCRNCIRQRNLQMELVDVEHLLGGERIIFYFL